MLKIAYILTPVEYGGSEKINLVFLKNVNRDNYNVHPILLIRPWEYNNIFVNELNKIGYTSSKIPVAKRPAFVGRDYFRVIRCMYILYKILASENYDIVHTHGYFADIVGSVTSHLLNIPHIATCHGFISNDINLKIYKKIDKYSLRYCKRVIAVSRQIRRELLDEGIKESNVITIANAVDYTIGDNEIAAFRIERKIQLAVQEDEIIIGYVGRLSKEKGIEYLIRAGEILKKKNILFKILIVGEGNMRNELESEAYRMGLKDIILFTGFLTDVDRWLPVFDVFVLPSMTEGTPLALLEAMLYGIPVVASNVGGVPEIVKSEYNGILVNPGDTKGLADAICLLCENRELRTTLGKEARETVQTRYNVNMWKEW